MSGNLQVALKEATNRERLTIELPTGQLDVTVVRSDLPLDLLCGFAARQNPKRGFLFVSKVLGKHIPARPSAVRDTHRRLAAKIPSNLPGPVVVIGMAETAICLGHGVYDEYVRLNGREDVLFIHSTRYRLSNEAAVEFLEEHSHAADHKIYQPMHAADRSLFRCARSVVLVDDEASTGKTFVNLVRALQGSMPVLQQVVTVVLTDWRGAERRAATMADMPVGSASVSLLEGQYRFSPAANAVAIKMPQVAGNGQLKDRLLARNYGRLGLRGPLSSLPQVSLPVNQGQRLLVLGTGEFAYPPFLLAERLEEKGVDVYFQATTRSPIILGGAIGVHLCFRDNYEDRILNFLYNVHRGQYDRIVVCHETPASTLDSSLLAALGAEKLEF